MASSGVLPEKCLPWSVCSGHLAFIFFPDKIAALNFEPKAEF
jgi:hypothetical protein